MTVRGLIHARGPDINDRLHHEGVAGQGPNLPPGSPHHPLLGAPESAGGSTLSEFEALTAESADQDIHKDVRVVAVA
jgi:hypothetical protein